MDASSTTPAERARKGVALVLRRLQEPGTQAAIAAAMGVSESTVSRLKNEHLEGVAMLLAHAGIKLVPASSRCFDPDYIDAVLRLAKAHMKSLESARQLEWDDEAA